MPEVKAHETIPVPLHISMCANWTKILPSNNPSSPSHSNRTWKKNPRLPFKILMLLLFGVVLLIDRGWCREKSELVKDDPALCNSHPRLPTVTNWKYTPRIYRWLWFSQWHPTIRGGWVYKSVLLWIPTCELMLHFPVWCAIKTKSSSKLGGM